MTETAAPKGLIAEIFVGKRTPDCSNGGLSGRVNEVTVDGTRDADAEIIRRLSTLASHDEEPGYAPLPRASQVFEPTPERPAVVLVRRSIGGRQVVHVEPVERPEGTPWMAGGAYVATSDSRFGELVGFYGAVSLHDRTESWAQYRALSSD